MTFPITPDPSIHTDPTAASAQEAQFQAALHALQQMFAQIIPQIIELVVNRILKAFGLTGIEGTVDDLLNGLENAFENIPGHLIQGITADVQSLVDDVLGGSGNPIEGLASHILGLIGFPSIHPALPILGSGQMGTITPNLLLNDTFDTIGSMPAGSGWVWDGTHDHTGKTGSGSAKAVAGNADLSLIGNSISVLPNDVLTCSAWVEWNSLVSTGSPISLSLNVYDTDDNLLIEQIIQAVSSPGASSTWTKLSGSYTVPATISSVVPAEVALRFNVGSTASAGNVYFDDAEVTKPNLIGSSIIQGPLDVLNTLEQDFQNTIDTLSGTLGSTLTDVENRLANMLTNISTLNGSNVGVGSIADDFVPGVLDNLNTIVENLLGIGPADNGNYTSADSANAFLTTAQTALSSAGSILQHALTLGTHTSQISNLLSRVHTLETAGGGSAGPSPTGTSMSDDFSRTSSSSLGANWVTTITGTSNDYGTDGSQAYWSTTGGTSLAFNIWQAGGTDTDYQIISQVIGNYAPTYGSGYFGWNLLYGRVGSTTQMTFALRADGYWEFRAGGSVLQSGNTSPLGVGGTMTFYCGDLASSTLQKYTLMVNNLTVFSGTGSGSTGSSFRGVGFGNIQDGAASIFVPEHRFGGKVSHWSGSDQS